MSNPFEDDDNDLFGGGGGGGAMKQQPQQSYANGRGSAPGAAHNPAAMMAAQMATQQQQHGANDKAARLYAASQANAAAAAAAAAAAPQRREGASASAFESRERNARHSLIQTQAQHGGGGMGGPAVAFPMTDLVDAQNDKKIGLSFASLAVRDGRSRAGSNEGGGGLQVEGGVAPGHAHKPVQAATVDPWAQSAFSPTASNTNNPFGQPVAAPVFRNPPPQQQRQQPQPQQQQARAPPAANLMDFDPLSFGDMSASAAPKAAPKAAASADPWGALAGQQSAPVVPVLAAAPAKKPKKKAPVVESSSSDDSDEEEEEDESEEDSDEDDGAAAAAAAARQKEKARQAQLAQRERERAEAVAYDEKRKADLAAARRASASGASSSSGSQHPLRMQSRALDASDESTARDIAANETDAEKLKRSGTKQSYPKAVVARWGSNPAEHWAYSKTKTRSKLMMPKVCVYWRFIWAGVRHEVELFHSTVSGKRTIRCDGALVAQEKLFIDTGSRHDFTIGTGTRPCQVTVLICSSGSEFAYELFVNKVRFYQALQAWLIDLQKDPSAAANLEPLSPHAINTVGEMAQRERRHPY